MKEKVLISYWVPEDCLAPYSDGYEFVCPTREKLQFSREELLERLPDCSVFYVIRTNVDAEMMAAAPGMKVLVNYRVGYDNIDMEAAARRKLPVLYTPLVPMEATAELTVAILMAMMRNVALMDRELRKGNWITGVWPEDGCSIMGRTLGVVGYGRIGQAVARKARGLGMNIAYYDVFRPSAEVEAAQQAQYMVLDGLLSCSDCITMHTPYTKENYHFCNDAFFAKMKKGSYFINCSRGAVVDEAALIRALQSGHLAGAGLDVFEDEPNVPKELCEMQQVVLTPHAGTRCLDIREKMFHEGMGGLAAFLAGEITYQLVNPDIVKP